MREMKAIVAQARATIAAHQKEHGAAVPRVGLILGSGLGELTEAMDGASCLATSDLEGYPASTVQGHAGKLWFGTLEDVPVTMLAGRIHAYEGHDLATLGLPARILCSLGLELLVITNAAGGVNRNYAAGDIMLIRDHVSFLGGSPLEGPNVEAWGPRFPDMSTVYPEAQRSMVRKIAEDSGLTLQEGVYAAMRGPQYETPAEIRMLEILGVDAVGMSTVPEAIVAAHMGIPVIGLSLISNPAAGHSAAPLDHQEVLAAGAAAAPRLQSLIRGIIGTS